MDSLETLVDLASTYRAAVEAADLAKDDLRAHIARTSPAAAEPVPDPISDYAAAKNTGLAISTVRAWRGKPRHDKPRANA